MPTTLVSTGLSFPSGDIQTSAAYLLKATNPGSAITLLPNQYAYYTPSAATALNTNINVASGQIYQLLATFNGNSSRRADAPVYLYPNNISYTNLIRHQVDIETNSTTSYGGNFLPGFILSYSGDAQYINATIVICPPYSSSVSYEAFAYTPSNSNMYLAEGVSVWQATASDSTAGPSSTAWTSFGQIASTNSMTGDIRILRLF